MVGIGGGLVRSGSGGGSLDPDDDGGEGDRVSRWMSNETRRLEEGLSVSSVCDLSV